MLKAPIQQQQPSQRSRLQSILFVLQAGWFTPFVCHDPHNFNCTITYSITLRLCSICFNILKDSRSSLHPLTYDELITNYDDSQAPSTHGSDDDHDYENNDNHRIVQNVWPPHSSQNKRRQRHSESSADDKSHDWSSADDKSHDSSSADDKSHDLRPKSRAKSRRSQANVNLLRKAGLLNSLNSGRERATTFKNGLRQVERLKRVRHKDGVGGESPRLKRHVGPHDEGGLQRLISTGRGISASFILGELSVSCILGEYFCIMYPRGNFSASCILGGIFWIMHPRGEFSESCIIGEILCIMYPRGNFLHHSS